MSSPEKGMTSEQASLKKVAGHINEEDFATLIRGSVNQVDQQSKQDVHDKFGKRYSVKSGKKWQIFMYAKSRLEDNTTLRGISNLSALLINCINTLPETRDMREENPARYKELLMGPMQALAKSLLEKDTLKAFFSKSIFEAGGVDYLAILSSEIDQTQASPDDKVFHVFQADEVIDALCDGLEVTNSMARGKGQTSYQKVVFRCWREAEGKRKARSLNMGEIELRTDKPHYGNVKFWLQSNRVLPLLIKRIPKQDERASSQLLLYGKAKRIRLDK